MKRKFNLKERIQQFKAWQEAPHPVAPSSEEEHECANCHDHYQGKFCPRCGQSAQVGRYSFKTVIMNFIEAAGMGERGMFRTIKELLLRPGYLIRDYLKGMQASYFAPFKLFFLLSAISILVTHGVNIKGENYSEETFSEAEIAAKSQPKDTVQFEGADSAQDKEIQSKRAEYHQKINEIPRRFFNAIIRFNEQYPSILNLIWLMYISICLFSFFRHSPNIPDMKYSEFFVTLIYTNNMYTIYSIVLNFFCLPILATLTFVLAVIPLKQVSGFSWWRTILKTVVASLIMFVLLIILFIMMMFCIFLFVKWFG